MSSDLDGPAPQKAGLPATPRRQPIMSGKPGIAGEARRALAPLAERDFRRIWLSSLLSSLGQLIFGVAVAWEMTRLSNAPKMIALVQTAMMVPLTFITLPAGALADMFDRRKIAMFGLAFSACSAGGLALAGFIAVLTPAALLAACVLVGIGTALYIPSWQSSIPEQVSRENVPAAVALSSLSANAARSIGPAIGGLIILAAGARTAFAFTAACFLPLLCAYFLWRRAHLPSRLPPERIQGAITAGMRYAFHSPTVRTALIRVLLFALMIAPGPALAPLVARTILQGGPLVLGLLLGSQGIGAVMAAFWVSYLRSLVPAEVAVRWLSLGAGLSLFVIGLSQTLMLTAAAFFCFGGCFVLTLSSLNVDVQLSAPRWVAARVVSLYTSAVFAGQGLGAWFWGMIANTYGISVTFVVAGIATGLSIVIGLLIPLRTATGKEQSGAGLEVRLDLAMPLTARSGPIVIEVIYNVSPAQARDFYAAVLKMRAVRRRIGGYDWSIARDVANPAIWTERYHCSTWGDYLRMISRYSESDMEVQRHADSYHRPVDSPRTIRRLERPFGSVRWKPESFDPEEELLSYIGPIGPG